LVEWRPWFCIYHYLCTTRRLIECLQWFRWDLRVNIWWYMYFSNI